MFTTSLASEKSSVWGIIYFRPKRRSIVKEVIKTSNAKIILMGEHSVVYNQPASALPIRNVKTTVKYNHPCDISKCRSLSFNGFLNDIHSNLLGIKQLINQTLTTLGKPHYGLLLDIDSQIPAERGMGSSFPAMQLYAPCAHTTAAP